MVKQGDCHSLSIRDSMPACHITGRSNHQSESALVSIDFADIRIGQSDRISRDRENESKRETDDDEE
jgi:hypothetical protein